MNRLSFLVLVVMLALLIENMHSGKAFLTKSGLGSDDHHLRPLETQLYSNRGS